MCPHFRMRDQITHRDMLMEVRWEQVGATLNWEISINKKKNSVIMTFSFDLEAHCC